MLSSQDLFNDFVGIALRGALTPSNTRAREGWSGTAVKPWVPEVDTAEREDAYAITLDLPGVKPEDVSITYEDGSLSIAGKRDYDKENKEGGTSYILERARGHFERQFRLPKAVDAEKISARFEHGVLMIELPKAASAKPRTISIGTGSNTHSVSSGENRARTE